MIVWYDGRAEALERFETRDALDAWQEDVGMYGGEIEHDTETGMYRAPDWDSMWRAFASPEEAAHYYNELAR